MNALTEAEKTELKNLIDAGELLPERWVHRLFPARGDTQIGKEYRLVYDGKMTREEVLAETPAAPWQLVRSFCDDNPHEDGWQNLLVWGDNLMAMRELLADQHGLNRFGTRDKIKLVYIDPPFATRKDFMKDREKAYQDKVLGSRFIEFLRRRIVLLRELLADDGVLFLHLDAKKHHYMKAVLDELFGEHNLVNDITWKRSHAHGNTGQGAKHFGPVTEKILLYAKGEGFHWVPQYQPYSRAIEARDYKYTDENTGEKYRLMPVDGPGGGAKGNPYYEFLGVKGYWRYSKETMQDLYDKGEIILSSTGRSLSRIRYLKDAKGTPITDLWDDIGRISPTSSERVDYPTQKPESLIERILSTCTKEGDIVLDCFAGSGTTPAVAEKLGRKWIAMDCGKLATYTSQKRLFSLSTRVGSPKKDERYSVERVNDWGEHEKKARGVFFIVLAMGPKPSPSGETFRFYSARLQYGA
ncbi:MAG: site-specific DNA-methyltransferase [Planctomycetota bacterium]|nr:MAG: site-specific DNA-methyltransferase [Planctomycetota bacterium]REK31629.1 MAG: site-specific DNA-methyltransferase [Planctomycetota bacterium]REK42369.1 MAG: site-specific DNA-methyltransferase [Planctomycetota bacterium]